MNKYTLIAALAAPAFVCVSCTKSEETLTQEWVEQIEEFVQTLNECDSSNADSKAKDLTKIADRHNDTKTELEKLHPGEPLTMKNVLAGNRALEERAGKSVGSLFAALIKLEKADYYGSAELREAAKRSKDL